MSAVKRFLFEDSFDDAVPAVSDGPALAHDDRALRVREDRARADGFEAGRGAARDEAGSRLADAVEQMAAHLAASLAGIDMFVAEISADAAELAIAAANQLAGPAAPPRFAAHASERLASIIVEQIGSPRITVSVAPAMQMNVQAAADHVVGASGYAGRVDVVADTALGGCDLVIDWRTGALAERRRDRLDALAGKIAEYFDISKPEGEA